MMRIKPALLGLCFLPWAADGQQPNLLANNSFEDVNTCTEYHAQCAPAAWFTVSPPEFDWPAAKEGDRTLSILYDNVYAPMTKRTFPYTMTLCPLKPGKEYELSMWLYTGRFVFSHLDILLTAADPARTIRVIGKTQPTFSLTPTDIVEKDATGWMLLRKKFPVTEEEKFFLFGNMQMAEHYTGKQLRAGGKNGNILFWIDDMTLSPTDSLEKLCASVGYTQSVLYQEHHRHTKHIYLDSLPANSVPLQTGHDTLVGSATTPPLFAAPPADTLLVPGIFFATNSSAVKSSYARQLDSLIAGIGDKKLLKIEINGHTDNTATDEWNDALSLRRAASIRDYIVKRLPRVASLVIVNGYGSHRPAASNDTPVGKARNRRVEIVLMY